MKKTLIAVLACVALVGLANVASAALIVDWGGDYVTANQSFQTTGNYATVLSPAANYSGTSATFYGDAGGTKYGSDVLTQNAAGDTIRFKVTNGAVGDTAYQMVYWKQADYLVGDVPVNFDASGSLISVEASKSSTNTTATIRGLIEVGDSWYVTDATTIVGAMATYTWDPRSVSWYQFTPSGDPLTYTIAGSSTVLKTGDNILTIQAAGYFAHNIITSGTTGQDIQVKNVEITASLVPEPASLILLAAGSLLMFRRRNRK